MKLIVGLGNIGNEFDKTRHNVGFMFLDYVTNNAKFTENKKNKAFEYETSVNGEKVLYIKPTTFMNLSGDAVKKYVSFYKIKIDDIIVIQDDLDIEIGKFKLSYNHGDGGHNGIKNIMFNLNSKEFLRLKIGISKQFGDTKEYVLGKFSSEEYLIINDVFRKLTDLIDDFVNISRDNLIGKYNSFK